MRQIQFSMKTHFLAWNIHYTKSSCQSMPVLPSLRMSPYPERQPEKSGVLGRLLGQGWKPTCLSSVHHLTVFLLPLDLGNMQVSWSPPSSSPEPNSGKDLGSTVWGTRNPPASKHHPCWISMDVKDFLQRNTSWEWRWSRTFHGREQGLLRASQTRCGDRSLLWRGRRGAEWGEGKLTLGESPHSRLWPQEGTDP